MTTTRATQLLRRLPTHAPPPLTDEQQAVVDANGDLRVLAFAGTGKTTVLQAYALARPAKRMLYLAFNRSIAAAAGSKFPANVSCSTIHALAFKAVGRRYQHKLRGAVRPDEAAKALGLNPQEPGELGQAALALKLLVQWHCSAAEEFVAFAAQHQTRQNAVALAAAERLWRLQLDSGHGLPMTHEGYLKVYQLTRPQLPYDTILFDEAQDSNPVTLAVVLGQPATKVFVGDPHQSIYSFRYATNAMADAGLGQLLHLTESFRFGAGIAADANRLLSVKRETRELVGGRRGAPTGTTAFLARGNAAVYTHAVELVTQHKRIHFVGGISGYRLDLLLEVCCLRVGATADVKDPFLRGFQSYAALEAYAHEQDSRDLLAWLGLLERHRNWREIPGEIHQLQTLAVDTAAAADVAVATAHKSKGLEFGRVELADDFPAVVFVPEPASSVRATDYPACWDYGPTLSPQLWGPTGFRGALVLPVEELNLRYVALTRAEHTCVAPQWGDPMFADLAAFTAAYPDYVQLERAPVPPKVTARPVRLPVDTHGAAAGAVVTADHAGAAVQAVGPTAAVAAGGVEATSRQWVLGVLDADLVRAVVNHYDYRYPALDWGWLLTELSTLRLVSVEPVAAVEAFLAEHQLGSTGYLVLRYLLDVGLVQHVGD
ncbi:UvrD-helicase domain-containing protein [Cyanobium sp. ATX 6F1]|uniref:UvrD-helicase domain-containing protein n=1 Tax=unclassified Cyanobium TaxID=2627006 RepID=UPI0020CBA770|nr:UvrD-helicase domain-containing protein [Cyanobium sp. ATX 6F1]MCP9916242.1 UvrD-helicase domain-containing protein [Cyanobium sp. ATX 6F1]